MLKDPARPFKCARSKKTESNVSGCVVKAELMQITSFERILSAYKTS